MRWQHGVMAVLSNPSEPTTRSTLQQKAIGVLIWLAFAVASMAALYFLSFLARDLRARFVHARFGSKAGILRCESDVCFNPRADMCSATPYIR